MDLPTVYLRIYPSVLSFDHNGYVTLSIFIRDLGPIDIISESKEQYILIQSRGNIDRIQVGVLLRLSNVR